MRAPTPLSHGQHVRALATPSFRLLETCHPRGMRLARHEHERSCLNFVLDGCYREDFGAREHAFEPLTCLYKPGGASHANRFTHAAARCLLIELQDESLVDPDVDLGEPLHVRSPDAARSALAVWHELAEPDACAMLAVEQLALESIEAALREGLRRDRSRGTRAARETLHDDPRRPWTLSSLARHVGLHPSHLARSFRARHGCTLGEYQRRLRLNAIARELALGERTIAELVLEQGFADQSHGTRAFRRQFGTTPLAFRRAFRGRRWGR